MDRGSSQGDAMMIGEQFLQAAAKRHYVGACLYVVEQGAVLNPCRNDLESRADRGTLERPEQ